MWGFLRTYGTSVLGFSPHLADVFVFFRPRRPSRWRLEKSHSEWRCSWHTFNIHHRVQMNWYVCISKYIYIYICIYTYSFTFPLLDIVSSGDRRSSEASTIHLFPFTKSPLNSGTPFWLPGIYESFMWTREMPWGSSCLIPGVLWDSSYICGSATCSRCFTWSPGDLYFWRSTPQNKGQTPSTTRVIGFPGTHIIIINRDHLQYWSKKEYIYIYIYITLNIYIYHMSIYYICIYIILIIYHIYIIYVYIYYIYIYVKPSDQKNGKLPPWPLQLVGHEPPVTSCKIFS